jgi:diacylglycerol kinase family enzyme
MRALVVLNPRARRGTALCRYDRVRTHVEAGFRTSSVLFDADGRWREAVLRARHDRWERVVAAGGDGTVNAVANALLGDEPASDGPTLGAVGLGSSNDFHKPIQRTAFGIPLRLGPMRLRHAGLARWTDAAGTAQSRWFFASASLGATARANRCFADDRGLLPWIGARSVDAAIALAAARAVARHADVGASIRLGKGGAERRVALSNLGVMLGAFVAGQLRYGAAPAPGTFAVHACEGMTRVDLLRTALGLLRGRFVHRRARSAFSPEVRVDLDAEGDVELDGEIVRACSIELRAFPHALAVCS